MRPALAHIGAFSFFADGGELVFGNKLFHQGMLGELESLILSQSGFFNITSVVSLNLLLTPSLTALNP